MVLSLQCVCVSYSVTSDSLQPHGLWPARLLHPWDFPDKDTVVGCHFLLQWIFLTQSLNPISWVSCWATSCFLVQSLSCVWLWPHGLKRARLPCPSLSPRVCSNSCPLSRSCHSTISSSVARSSSCPQYFPVSGSFPISHWSFSFSTSPSNEYSGLTREVQYLVQSEINTRIYCIT